MPETKTAAQIAHEAFTATLLAHQFVDDDLHCVCGASIARPVNRGHAQHQATKLIEALAAGE